VTLRALDLFCGAGGVTKGLQRAGFHVLGVDIEPQPHYCGELFVQDDVMAVLEHAVREPAYITSGADFVWASPPCQAYTDLQKQNKREYDDLIAAVREALQAIGLPYVIENVEGAPLIDPVKICGASLPGLRVIRHRLFESNVPLIGIDCPAEHPLVFTHDKRKAHHGQLDQNLSFVQVTGGGNATIANKRSAMGIDWMTNAEINEAIPPLYAQWIGVQLVAHLS
jgi:DNA (cytosine-5)-methyltransferase 1